MRSLCRRWSGRPADATEGTYYANQCYGLSPARLAAWWRACTDDSSAFSTDPLWLARYGTAGSTGPAA